MFQPAETPKPKENREQAAPELDRSNRSGPVADLGGIGLIHIEEVRHHRLHDRLAGVIRRHRYEAVENLE